MLVLINAEIFDVGDPLGTLKQLGVGDVREIPTPTKLARLGQDAAFAGRGIENAHVGIRQTLAALMALSGQANCALFLCPPDPRSARDVAVRFGLAPLTTLAMLLSLQQAGRLTPALINHHVWRVAQGGAAA
jgi:hypothetical protein